MEKQKYPARRYFPGGKIIPPYDHTSWSLPLHMGVKSIEINQRSTNLESVLEKIKGTYKFTTNAPEKFFAAIYSVTNNESFKAAFLASQLGIKVDRLAEPFVYSGVQIPRGSFVIYYKLELQAKLKRIFDEMRISPIFLTENIKLPVSNFTVQRIAVVDTYFHDMDAGWTRFLFDSYYIPFTVVRPGDFEKTDFVKDFDIVIFSSQKKSLLIDGKFSKDEPNSWDNNNPPEFTKGIGKKGMDRLMIFLDQGGIIVSWGDSTEIFTNTLEFPLGKDQKEEFDLPIENLSKKLTENGLYCPGSFLNVILAKDHLLTLGMEDKSGIFFTEGPVYQTRIPELDMDRRVIAKFPEDNILDSGYCEKEELLSDKSIAVWLKKGKGQIILFGFSPQQRASTQITYKLLFNSLLLQKIK
jgi:hypothetical protein